ncbi:Sarcosine oxidase subunit alpha [Aliiroseovarius sp. xm-m-379]|uniref:sarcosine oxidase subunit alpha family protein n=1 Tax=unclassified Aliiroseovarius TaxID=2623558 RepID=UPI00156955EB|nr:MULTISPECIES: sarcosine oxidase subunit alpha family protein [unclassified Aliiroseovarius]NRP11596.1 Sarcosine oxidase subunit alpha [Aliiroseovarius sp. xm-d-517]NRP25791.1 Sarcosine oxidase subunit alpha [Aliiroseovarius sp. xm-m-379]NRP31297.1 Sarcosine oxidase subunit alpha [Aliiroseovarius sp. xm-m-314]NRP34590.1 Sarcosine oxidase subunit alpha [Aliiroseovarius sp. xm-a-104]NRP42024.1 Sarcosine oxidase subunit alpha [Aliiroseovarius sp. xm-m-339-2]
MSTRLSTGGRLIDRSKVKNFTFNGKKMKGFEGDTLASALLGEGQTLVGRSFKYHRPRGIIASGAEEPNALVNMGEGARFEPNQRVTTTELFDGLTAGSQNHWPSLEFDVGVVNNYVSRWLPAGFYYKTFMFPRAGWKHVFEPIVRQSAGLGKAPDAETFDADRYEHYYHHTDILVVGGGVAGLAAALAAAKSGKKVMLIEQTNHWGGRAPVDGGTIDGKSAAEWVDAAVAELEALDNVTLRTRTMGAGVYDHGYVTGYERVADHTPGDGRPRHRLWRIRAGQIVTATGAIERPLSFAGNDIPGVMLAGAVRDYLVNWGVSAGDRVVVVTNNDDAYRTALAVKAAGLEVPVIIDARPNGGGALADAARDAGIRVENGKAIGMVKGGKSVTGVTLCAQQGEGATLEEIACDAVAMSGGWSPVVHLWSHCGGKLNWDEANAMFRPDASRPPLGANGEGFVIPAGSADGEFALGAVLDNAVKAGLAAAGEGEMAAPKGEAEVETDLEPVWIMPQGAGPKKRMKMWLDYQNDVKVSDVQLAAREGYESVEHTKRYTTLGMATDQGKLSNINGLAVLSNALGQEIPTTGTTTFRPPYHPISMGAITGEARAEIFQPIRRTPMHEWHEEQGAYMEPVGHWRRPYTYPRKGETHEQAVNREVINTRENLGLLDASTLGKLIVKGPDAGKFMDMMYTNMMSNLAVGKCRYGLMCSENGFLSDDGVVARIDEDTWLCHTTSGGADRIHGWMEEWLQTEWWDWKVYVANVTEQLAQVAVVGPNARKVLEKLNAGVEGGMDLSAEALPFMQWRDGKIGEFDARAYRISFSGELSYEIAVPASQGRAFWDALIEAGEEFGVMPYGTECLHIMRAEKGFIMIGDETDGTVIPQDLGLNWAISKKKEDFLGKRAQLRSHMTDPERWKLVGLETLDGSVLPDGAYAQGEGVNENGQKVVIGRVTSTYYSPTLKRGIAMGLVKHGPDRMGEVISFPTVDGTNTVIKARICDPVFYDKDGEKQNV